MSEGAVQMQHARVALMAVVAVALLLQSVPYPAAAMTCTSFQSNLSRGGPIVFEGSWYSADNTSALPLANNSVIEGDRTVLLGAFYNENLPQPVIRTECNLIRGILFGKTGDLVIPISTYSPFSDTVNITQFAWLSVPGIEEGDNVRVTVDFANGDCDIMSWWADTDNRTWTYGSNLLENQMVTANHPEVGSFISNRDGTLTIGVFDNDSAPGSFEATIDTRAEVEFPPVNGTEVEFSTTDYLARNIKTDIAFLGWVDGDSAYRVDYENVTIVNYFAPEVLDILVTGQGSMKTIRWTIHDRNALETHNYKILLSSDRGASHQLLADDLTSTVYSWDSTGFIIREYQVTVVATDSHGDTGTGLSDPFLAGTYRPGGPIPVTTITQLQTTSASMTHGIESEISIMVTLASVFVVLAVLVQWRREQTSKTGA